MKYRIRSNWPAIRVMLIPDDNAILIECEQHPTDPLRLQVCDVSWDDIPGWACIGSEDVWSPTSAPGAKMWYFKFPVRKGVVPGDFRIENE